MSTQSVSIAQENPEPAVQELSDADSKNRKSATAFRTISEVADDLDVQQHVLRFWETKFSQIRPLKRGGGRRYYRPEDVALLKSIHNLLYTEGYTIKGVQKLLKEQGKNKVVQNNKPAAASAVAPTKPVSVQHPSGGMNTKHRAALESMLDDLREIRKIAAEG